MTITRDGNVFRIDATKEMMADLVRLPGRRASGSQWTVPVLFTRHVADFADKYGLELDALPPAGYTAPSVTHDGNAFQVVFDFTNVAQVEQVAGMRGSHWFQPLQCWLVPTSSALELSGWVDEHEGITDNKALQVFYDAKQYGENVKRSSAKESAFNVGGIAYELYDYQRAGVDYILNVAGGWAILGDEPGVGKTLQAIAALKAKDAFPALIIVPASLKPNWRREIQEALPDVTVEILRGKNPVPRLWWADVSIINYDILPDWEYYLPGFQGVVADETHKIKNPKIDRTKSAIRIMNAAPKVRLCVTGTAVQNRPKEALTQIQAIGKLEAFGGWKLASATYKNDPLALNHKLRGTCYVRRLKKDVWENMPARDWAPIMVEGTPAIMAEYERAEKDIIAYLAEQAREEARKAGIPEDQVEEAAALAAAKAAGGAHLVAITKLKQIAARAKMEAAKDWAKNFLDSTDDKLAIYGWHREVVSEMAKTLNAVKIHGGQTEQERDRAQQLFQKDDKVRVLCGQILAAGEGLTLHAASNALILEQAWTPGAHDQVLDRLHRRGQRNDVVGWMMLTEGTIDEDIHELIQAKRKLVSQTLDGFDRSNEGAIELDVQSQLISRLTMKGLKR